MDAFMDTVALLRSFRPLSHFIDVTVESELVPHVERAFLQEFGLPGEIGGAFIAFPTLRGISLEASWTKQSSGLVQRVEAGLLLGQSPAWRKNSGCVLDFETGMVFGQRAALNELHLISSSLLNFQTIAAIFHREADREFGTVSESWSLAKQVDPEAFAHGTLWRDFFEDAASGMFG